MCNALAHLCQLVDQRKAQRSPNYPAKRIPRSKYSDVTANGLKRCIVDYLNLSGHFAIKLTSTGTYRADLQKFVASQQRSGMPGVLACVNGQFIGVEVKIGTEQLSKEQKETIVGLIRADVSVYVARDFQGFYDWFTALVPILNNADNLPFGPYSCD